MDEIEETNFSYKIAGQEGKSKQNANYVPFRLTKNFEHFIGPVGLHGLFAGVMTAGALAIDANKTKFLAFLKLMFADEIQNNQDGGETDPDEVAEFVLFKIQSLCNHQRCVDYAPKAEENKAKNLPRTIPGVINDINEGGNGEGNYLLGNTQVPKPFFDIEMDRPNIPEEYNKKVFALIEMACDDERRSQKAINWCSWF